MFLYRTLHCLARHFVTSIFSLHNSRHMDAQRVIVLAGMCCLADAILRLPTTDAPSPLGAHYSGRAEGPIKPFVFDISFFADQSEFFLLSDPILTTARTQVWVSINVDNGMIPCVCGTSNEHDVNIKSFVLFLCESGFGDILFRF